MFVNPWGSIAAIVVTSEDTALHCVILRTYLHLIRYRIDKRHKKTNIAFPFSLLTRCISWDEKSVKRMLNELIKIIWESLKSIHKKSFI